MEMLKWNVMLILLMWKPRINIKIGTNLDNVERLFSGGEVDKANLGSVERLLLGGQVDKANLDSVDRLLLGGQVYESPLGSVHGGSNLEVNIIMATYIPFQEHFEICDCRRYVPLPSLWNPHYQLKLIKA